MNELNPDTSFGVIKTSESIIINAPNERVIKTYRDYKNWNKLFPETISNTRLLEEKNGTQTVEVDHKKAGKVINILQFLSPIEIELKEFKPLYNAIFINRFQPANGGTNYTVNATIFIKSILKILAPFLKSLVKRRIKNYVLDPMKDFVEKNQ